MPDKFPITYPAEADVTGVAHDEMNTLIYLDDIRKMRTKLGEPADEAGSTLLNIAGWLTSMGEYNPIERMSSKETFMQKVGEVPFVMLGAGALLAGTTKKVGKKVFYHGGSKKLSKLSDDVIYSIQGNKPFAESYSVGRHGQKTPKVTALQLKSNTKLATPDDFHKTIDDIGLADEYAGRTVRQKTVDYVSEADWARDPRIRAALKKQGYDGVDGLLDFGFRGDFEQLPVTVIFNAKKSMRIVDDVPARKAVKFRESMPKKVIWKSRGGTSIPDAEREIVNELVRAGDINPKAPFDVDLTYGKGKFYEHTGLPQPKIKFDINPMAEDVVKVDLRNWKSTGLNSNSVGSVYLDPPFQIAGSPRQATSKYGIAERFGEFPDIEAAEATWLGGVREASRILKQGGVLIVKIQDMKAFRGHKAIDATERMIKFAEDSGLRWVKPHSITKQMPMMMTPQAQLADPARQSITNYLVFVK
jgi:hypothetical protein